MRTSLAVIPLAFLTLIAPTPSIIVSMTGLTTIKDADARRYKRVPSAHARAEWLAKKLREERAWSEKIAKDATKKINDERKWADRVRLKADRDREALRAELEATRKQLTNNAAVILPPVERSVPSSPLIEMAMIRIPDVREFPGPLLQPPVSPQTAALIQPEFEIPKPPPVPGTDWDGRVRSATVYLIKTATIGGTMRTLGPDVAIGNLHPVFRVRLADAIREARAAGLKCAGVFSAYRPPFLEIGGFRDKFNSAHSYGIAVDMACIGRPGSKQSALWHRIATKHGLYRPYAASWEWNHYQPVTIKAVYVGHPLRGTITRKGPKDLRKMWLASGLRLEQSGPFVVTSRAVERTKIRKPQTARR